MDIFNKPPTIPDDTLQYTIYPVSGATDKSSVASLAAFIQSVVQSLLPNHIWHRDAFELRVVAWHGSGQDTWKLEGRMRVGDSVDDEWCVVWLLKEISERWDVAISVCDSDGEFLLIEAAESLPNWLTPTNAENRVWIYQSHIHIIPISYTSPSSRRPTRRRPQGASESNEEPGLDDDTEGFIAVDDALKLLRDPQRQTASLKAVEDTIWARTTGYPAFARQHIHKTKAYLPEDVAEALSQNPPLVQKATEAFYTRDPVQLRAVHRMSRFPPEPSTLTVVKITRTAYAQLVGQRFHPPKIFGQFKEPEDTRQWIWRDVGMKIACGFEMLYQESNSRSLRTSISEDQAKRDGLKDALRRDAEYTKYVESLLRAGYFKSDLQGSAAWMEREDKAAEVFVSLRSSDDSSRPSFASLVNAAISRAGDRPLQGSQEEEDSDEWLNVDAATFDAKLADSARPSAARLDPESMDVDRAEDKLANAEAMKLEGLAKKVEDFVEGEGTMEGAVFDDDILSDDETMSESSDEPDPSARDENDQADAERREAMDKLVAGLNPDEYGKMPASFYSNSQKVAPTIMETDTVPVESSKPTVTEAALENEPPKKPTRRPILQRDNFDGVDSDDETDDEDVNVQDVDDESEEDRPQVIGDVEIDMGEEEEEFLKFARDTLGISDDQWREIERDRRGRGAYLPKSSSDGREPPSSEGRSSKSENVTTRTTQAESRVPQSGPRPNVNPNLDSFEAVMQAMDEELTRARTANKKTQSTKPTPVEKSGGSNAAAPSRWKDKGKSKVSFSPVDDGNDGDTSEDIGAAMDSELRAALEHEEGDSGDDGPMDYTLIKNFLQSFKSQAGLSGPVSNLAGRLEPGWQLPRDNS